MIPHDELDRMDSYQLHEWSKWARAEQERIMRRLDRRAQRLKRTIDTYRPVLQSTTEQEQ